MSISNEKARKLWNDVYGENTLWASDCFGTWIYRDDHGDYQKTRIRPNGSGKGFNYGWDVDHIRPKSDFSNENDADFDNNYEPVHRSNNESKADNYPQFEISSKTYKVVKCDICGTHSVKGYGIVEAVSGKRIDWKGTQKKFYNN